MLTRTRCLVVMSLLAIASACDNANLIATNREAQADGGASSASGAGSTNAGSAAESGGATNADAGAVGSAAANSGGNDTGAAGVVDPGSAGTVGTAGSGGNLGTAGSIGGASGAATGGSNGTSGASGAANGNGGASGGAAGSGAASGNGGAGGSLVTPTGLGKAECSAQIGGSNASVNVRGVAGDALGNLFITGSFFGTANFGGKSLSSQGSSQLDMFLAKYDSKCKLKWAQSFSSNASGGPNSVDQGWSVAVASNGDVLVTGGAAAAINLGGGIIAKNGGAFYARYTTDGVHVWSHLTGNNVAVWGMGIAIAPNGNVAVVTDAGFDPTNNPARVSEYTGGGNPAWASNIAVGAANGQNTSVSGVAVDPSGNVFVTGTACPAAGCGSCPIGKSCYPGSRNLYLSAYSAVGAPAWAHVVTSDNSALPASSAFNQGRAVAANAGNVVIGGLASPPLDFGAGSLPGLGSWDAYVARYSSSGSLAKAFLDGDTGPDFISGLAVDAGNNVAFVGQSGTQDVVGVYTAAGGLLWIKALATFSIDAVALTPQQVVAAVGEFTKTVDFGGTAVAPVGTQDGFLTTYDE